MRKRALVPLLVLAAAAWITISAGDEEPWFDLVNCTMCKNLGAEEGLIQNARWESHPIDDGMLTVMTIPAEYREKFERAHENMMAAAARLQSGEPATLCGFCKSYGGLMMSGAKTQSIKTSTGHVELVTATDPKVVAAIHAHMKRTNDEAKKFYAALEGGHD